ncbi:hypothetical protein HK098_005559 [Nowakowskiella sp. JEL0407]|nr:hypothetical protein HK098_005559 [Nowakowskiella sp. JEL0407]
MSASQETQTIPPPQLSTSSTEPSASNTSNAQKEERDYSFIPILVIVIVIVVGFLVVLTFCYIRRFKRVSKREVTELGDLKPSKWINNDAINEKPTLQRQISRKPQNQPPIHNISHNQNRGFNPDSTASIIPLGDNSVSSQTNRSSTLRTNISSNSVSSLPKLASPTAAHQLKTGANASSTSLDIGIHQIRMINSLPVPTPSLTPPPFQYRGGNSQANLSDSVSVSDDTTRYSRSSSGTRGADSRIGVHNIYSHKPTQSMDSTIQSVDFLESSSNTLNSSPYPRYTSSPGVRLSRIYELKSREVSSPNSSSASIAKFSTNSSNTSFAFSSPLPFTDTLGRKSSPVTTEDTVVKI